MDRKVILLSMSLMLFVSIILFLYFGCTCTKAGIERFEVNPSSIDKSDLSSKEQELFQDLITNKLSTEQITELVKGGVLTQNMVEKFLDKLDANLYDTFEGGEVEDYADFTDAEEFESDMEDV